MLEDLIGPVPSSSVVLETPFSFKPVWWEKRIGNPDWTGWFSTLPVDPELPDVRLIDRATLLTIGQRHSPETLVAALVWGTGPQPFLVPRRSRMFAANDHTDLTTRLTTALSELDGSADDAVLNAYRALSRHGSSWIRYLGPSFFTKVLYAAGARRTDVGRALILDRFVAIALNDVCDARLSETGPWPASVYEQWLNFAHRQAAILSDLHGVAVRADAVELAMFCHGKQVSSRKRSAGAYPAGRSA